MAGFDQYFINLIITLSSVLLIGWCRSVKIQPHLKRDLLIGIICSISIVLCMSFSFQVLPGYIFDLRTVPFIIGILYGGLTGGALSAFTLYVFRFYLGGDGVWNVLIVYSIIMVLAFLIVPLYSEMNHLHKRLTSTSMAIMTAILMMLNTNFREGLLHQAWAPVILYVFFHGIAAWLSIYFIERVACRIPIHETKLWNKPEGSTMFYSSNH